MNTAKARKILGELNEIEKLAKQLHREHFAASVALGSKTYWSREPERLKDAWREMARRQLNGESADGY